MRAVRLELSRAHPDAAQRAADLFPIEALAARIVSGYRPQGGEMDPGPLIRRLAAAGARLALPVAVSRDAPLIFRAWLDGNALAPDAYGIPAPTVAAPEVSPDLVIAPVLAFDARGGRLGQGAGAFDRTLAALRAAGPVWVIGLAYAGQEIPACPAEAHDQRLDAILTEAGYRRLGETSGATPSRKALT